ncbi:hypothetical protein [Actinoplanes utahensis]|nr:hypothetical protein [Actinoplanes utahensis]
MSRELMRPSRSLAIMIAVGAVALLIFGISQMIIIGEFHWFVALWLAAGIVIVALAVRRIRQRR